jgi:hypothetical protein
MELKKWIYENLSCGHQKITSFQVRVYLVLTNGNEDYCVKKFSIENGNADKFVYKKGFAAEYEHMQKLIRDKNLQRIIWAIVNETYKKLPKMIEFETAKIKRTAVIGIRWEWCNAKSRELTYAEYKRWVKHDKEN